MRIINFTPAITTIPKEIRRIASLQQPYFRTNNFRDLMNDNEALLLKTIGCSNGKVAFLTASGTGAMDAAISSFIKHADRVLIINAGTFGQKWVDICKVYKLNYQEFNISFGQPIDLDKLDSKIKEYRPTYILVQHNETSSMRLYPIQYISYICKRYSCKLIVDAISSFCIDRYTMDSWDIYATILSSQKGLGLSTGLSMVVMQEPPKTDGLSYYLNLKSYTEDWANTGIKLPFTPNTIVLNQLNYRLKQIDKIGIDKIVSRVHKQATDFRTRIFDLPLSYEEGLSNCGTLLYTDRTDVKYLFSKLQKKNIYFTPSGGDKGKKFIIGHIGDLKISDNKKIYRELKRWLNN